MRLSKHSHAALCLHGAICLSTFSSKFTSMAQCSQSPSFSLIIFGRRGSRWSGPSPSYSQFFFHTGSFCDIMFPVLLLSNPKPGPRERTWQECTILGVSRTHTGCGSQHVLVCRLHCLVITARRDLAVIDVGMVGGMGVVGR